MTGHLGSRVSALLDGQLSAQETERAWAHVHSCHLCRDHVEREGWVKTRLAGHAFEPGPAPDELKGSLLGMPPGDVLLSLGPGPSRTRARRHVGLASLGGGAVGAAVMGILALGTAPADVPTFERRSPTSPTSNVSTSTPGPTSTPTPRRTPRPTPSVTPSRPPVPARTGR